MTCFSSSADHRGTPDHPGLVATLVPGSAEDQVVGMAYRVHPSRAASVIDTLDFREKGGYTRANVPITLMGSSQVDEMKSAQALVYYADESNPNYAKREVREQDERIAEIIAGRLLM